MARSFLTLDSLRPHRRPIARSAALASLAMIAAPALCSCGPRVGFLDPLEVYPWCGREDTGYDPEPIEEPSVTVLCGFEWDTPIGCSDTRVLQVSLRDMDRARIGGCEAVRGYRSLIARHHPIVDECLSPEEAAEVFGVTLCLREEE